MSDHTHDEHHDSHGGVGLYFGVFLALCILTGCSFLTYFDFWRTSVPVGVSRAFMMAVSCTKAMLVIMFFMHLKWEANWKWVLTVPASIMSALLIFALIPDVGLRMRYASQERMVHAAEVSAEADEAHGSAEDGHSEDTHESETVRPAA